MKQTRPLSNAWFQFLDTTFDHWNRLNENTIVIWLSNFTDEGKFVDGECWRRRWEAEPKIMAMKGWLTTNPEVDRMCGKMRLEVREPKGVLAERAAMQAALEKHEAKKSLLDHAVDSGRLIIIPVGKAKRGAK